MVFVVLDSAAFKTRRYLRTRGFFAIGYFYYLCYPLKNKSYITL